MSPRKETAFKQRSVGDLTSRATGALSPRTNVLAGLAVFAVLVPTALAYSSIVGVEPNVGLIGVPLALLGYGIFGGSKVVVVGADAAVSVLVGSAVASFAGESSASSVVIALSLMVGALYLLLYLFRFGWIADLVPTPALKGFIQGLSIVTILGQIPALLGHPSFEHSGFFRRIIELGSSLGDIDGSSAALGVAALAVLFGLKRFVPRAPAAMVALVAGGVAVAVFHLADHGVSVVAEPASLLSGLGSDLSIDGALLSGLLPAAAAIVVLGFTESLGASQIVSDQVGERTHPNRELLGLGAANVAVGVGGSFAVTGALSKTAVAVTSGARTRVANATAAVLALTAAIFLRPLFVYLAQPVLAAVVIWAMVGMIDLSYLRELWRKTKPEFFVAQSAFFGVIAFGVMPGVLIATLLAFVFLARHISRPPVELLDRDLSGRWKEMAAGDVPRHLPVGLYAVRFEGPLVYVNARAATEQLSVLARRPDCRAVVLDAVSVTAVDSTAIKQFDGAVADMRRQGQQFWIAGADERVATHYRRLSDDRTVRMFATLDDALQAYLELSADAPENPPANS
ncbi:MAG: SulP family inorganic anion transporter [Actinobacteria bacterium]|nr:SulP family inorganic anion transporter [Actinomycetota bacterium]